MGSPRTRLLAATTNRGKLPEIRDIMADSGFDVLCLGDALELGLLAAIPDVAEDTGTFEGNARKKALEITRLAGVPVLADDSGLEIDFLGGMPGVESAFFMGRDTPYEIRNRHIMDLLRDIPTARRTARFTCVIAVAYPRGAVVTARGVCEGFIAEVPTGGGGFGYDPVFFVPSLGKTFGQASRDEKNAVSHRALALRKMRELLT
ncbi:MAG: RdgB/HAM1 family non-canonical purine NTP pyrophosphatase [Defluviitaleaceae bacterium]|nr:RdgB/HAM1 family non-canonical purine NTP pyrophosphatase [Defluviitaleaceae bacterium]